jgi:hypothetical protein
MTSDQPSILLAHTYYPQFLADLYAGDASLADLDFEQQRRRVLNTGFGVADSCSTGLAAAGCRVQDIIVNADLMQARWAKEHGLSPTGNIHDRRREIVAAQIDHIRPDVLYVFEWCPLGDGFLADMKRHVRVLVGQIASPLHTGRTYRAYDLMISSFPPIVEHFRSEGIAAEPLRLAFDSRVLDHLASDPPRHDVTFVGGFAPSHPDRIAWLERLLEHLPIDIFGYGAEQAPDKSPVRRHHRGHAWGRRMYDVLYGSRITLNRHAHIDVRGRVTTIHANNMRLYEATGVGTCLVTESKANLADLFEPDREVVTYTSDDECIEKVRQLLEHEDDRAAIARAGQARTLREHTYTQRMRELSEILRKRI